jgi:Rieske Fe-S protein
MHSAAPGQHGLEPPPDRRSFLRWVTNGLGALFALVLGIPAVAYLIDPRNRPSRESSFRPVQGVKLSELRLNVPRQGIISDERRDAWTLQPDEIIGRVWVVKRSEARPHGRPDLLVFTTICPHLGCSIRENGVTNVPDRRFVCPCHNGTFHLDGSVDRHTSHTNPVPRTMDTLEWQVDPNNADLLQAKYENYYQGRHEKVRKA